MCMIKIEKANGSAETKLELFLEKEFPFEQQVDDKFEFYAESTNNKIAYKCIFVDIEGNEIPEVNISLNGEELERDNKDNKYIISRWLLEDAMGFAQLSVDYKDLEYVSKYISIWVRDTEVNRIEKDNLIGVLDYVYKNIDVINPKENLNSRLKLVEEIRDHYKEYFPYFLSQSHSAFHKKAEVGNIEKLRKITTATTRFMATHPQYMLPQSKEVHMGDPYDPEKYYPYKTLVNLGVNSFDTYENRVIVGFLKYLLLTLTTIDNQVELALERYSFKRAKEGYIYGPSILINDHKEKIKDFQQQTLNRYRIQLSQLLNEYERLFNIKAQPLREYPRFTPVFRSLPQYKALFKDINQWFNLGQYDLSMDMSLYFFHFAYDAYEKYCLINLIKEIPKYGFSYPDVDQLEYAVEGYAEKDFNIPYDNHFHFISQNVQTDTVDLYYQPVIHNKPNNGINLIRLDSDNSKRLYWPDFILKLHKANKNYYLICDAKFSTKNNTQKYHFGNPGDRKKNLKEKYHDGIGIYDKYSNDSRIGIIALYGKSTGCNNRADLIFGNFSYQYDATRKKIDKALDKQEGLSIALSPAVPFDVALKSVLEKIFADPMYLFCFDPDVNKNGFLSAYKA